MTTIVNTPPVQKESNGSMAMVIGFVGVIIVGYLFFVYGLPALRNVKIGTPEINIPTEVAMPENVNVNVTK